MIGMKAVRSLVAAVLALVVLAMPLVLHLWPERGCATLDLHVCDYRDSNRDKARRLRDALAALCFAHGSASWRELASGGDVGAGG